MASAHGLCLTPQKRIERGAGGLQVGREGLFTMRHCNNDLRPREVLIPKLKGRISNLSLIFQPKEQTLLGSFSSVSTPNFASKYSLESSWRDLQDLHAFAPLRPQYFRNFSSIFFAFFSKILPKFVIFELFSLIFAQIWWNFVGISPIVMDNLENVEIVWNFWIF